MNSGWSNHRIEIRQGPCGEEASALMQAFLLRAAAARSALKPRRGLSYLERRGEGFNGPGDLARYRACVDRMHGLRDLHA